MKSLWNHLGDMFYRQRVLEGFANAALMWASAVRALRFPGLHLELLRLGIFDKYIVGVGDPDVLFHLSHRHYLSNTFSQRERIECALTHYRFEDERYDSLYKEAVYGAEGIELWSCRVDEVCYALRLRAATELRHEGGVSVLLVAGEQVVCEMSYCWVGAHVVAALPEGAKVRDAQAHETIPFITKNQSVGRNSPELLRFRAAFPQNSPPYFCLAALHGIAQAHGMSRLAAIRHECQVAYEERHAGSFRNSYCEFWKSFHAVEAGRVAHVMPVPMTTPSILHVKPKHRRRALDRRRHWSEISRESAQVLGAYLLPAEGNLVRPLRHRIASAGVQMHAVVLIAAALGG